MAVVNEWFSAQSRIGTEVDIKNKGSFVVSIDAIKTYLKVASFCISNNKENYRYMYFINCNASASLCKHCKTSDSHGDHKLLQIYRHVYQDAICIVDMEPHVDCSKIQHFFQTNKEEKKMAAKEHSCCNKQTVNRCYWSAEEDEKLRKYISENNGHGRWTTFPDRAGLKRCGKSCRLRWKNYLRAGVKRGGFTSEEASLINQLHGIHGSKWAEIGTHLPGRTNNEIKNFWNSNLKKEPFFSKNDDGVGINPNLMAPNHEQVPLMNDLQAATSVHQNYLIQLQQQFHINLFITNQPIMNMNMSNMNMLEANNRFLHLESEGDFILPSAVRMDMTPISQKKMIKLRYRITEEKILIYSFTEDIDGNDDFALMKLAIKAWIQI